MWLSCEMLLCRDAFSFHLLASSDYITYLKRTMTFKPMLTCKSVQFLLCELVFSLFLCRHLHQLVESASTSLAEFLLLLVKLRTGTLSSECVTNVCF